MDSLFHEPEFHGNSNFVAYPSHQISDYGSSSTSEGDYKLASSNPKKRAGRKKFKETRHPVYRGIRRRNGDKWVCELRSNKSRLWLGTYPTAVMAARAHDVAALALRGKSACLNFADSVRRLPVPVSTSDDDIRKAAVEAAEAFRPQERGDKESEEWERGCSDAELSGSISQESDEKLEELNKEKEVMYFDEEALLFMPQLLVDMADGLLVSPPLVCVGSCNRGFDFDAGISLWNFLF